MQFRKKVCSLKQSKNLFLVGFQVGPNRDILGEFEKAVRKSNKLHFGFYHAFYEWINPLYLQDVASNFTTNVFAATKVSFELNIFDQMTLVIQFCRHMYTSSCYLKALTYCCTLIYGLQLMSFDTKIVFIGKHAEQKYNYYKR